MLTSEVSLRARCASWARWCCCTCLGCGECAECVREEMRIFRRIAGMNEGRRSQVVLLDDRRLDILIQPKLYACDLLDIVASHFCLREKEYFGLAYLDETGHYHWLQLDKRVLEHDLPRKATQGVLVLHFLIKYYVESISLLRDSTTVEAFYLQCKSLVGKGTIEADADTAFQLAALVLQATYGNYTDDRMTKNHLKKLPVLPTSALKEHPSIAYCENKVIEKYKDVAGLSRGSAIVSYMNIVETLPTYGIHFYEVKDKGGNPWWIGLSYKGISQYDYNDRKIPRKFFQWKLLENLYFRDKKFSIEVHNPRRVSVSRRTFGPGNVTVLVWFASTPSLTKCIWSMAIAQHQFYIDNKADSKKLEDSSNLERIAAELSKSCQSLSSSSTGSNLSRSASSHSLPTIKIEGNQNEESQAAREEMMCALKARKEALEEALAKRLEELRALCLKEGELTGEVPPEIPLEPGESMPQVRRRVGTSFLISDQLISKAKTQEEALSRLELEYELQNKITSAALRLASDVSADRSLRRQRKVTYQQEYAKLRQVKEKLGTVKKNVDQAKTGSTGQLVIEEQCDDNVSRSTTGSDTVFHEGSNTSDASPAPSPNPPARDAISLNFVAPAISVSAPPSPSKHRTARRTESPTVSSPSWTRYGQGYAPSTVYQTGTAYRRQQYPTLPVRSSEFEPVANSTVHLRSPYKNKFESGLSIEGSNLYSVQTQRTSQAFDSQDDILAAPPPESQDLGLVCRHNSLESNRRHHRRTRASPVTVGHARNSEPPPTSPSWYQASANSSFVLESPRCTSIVDASHSLSSSSSDSLCMINRLGLEPSVADRAPHVSVHVYQRHCTASPGTARRAVTASPAPASTSNFATEPSRCTGLVDASRCPNVSSSDTLFRTSRLGLAIDLGERAPHVHQQHCTASPGTARRAVTASSSYPEGLLMCNQEPTLQQTCSVRKTPLSKARSEGFAALRGEHSASFYVGSPEIRHRFSSHDGHAQRTSHHGIQHERKKANSDVAINVTDGINDVSLPKTADPVPTSTPPGCVGPHAAPKLETLQEGVCGSSYETQCLNMCLSSTKNFPQQLAQIADAQPTKPRAKDWVETSLDSPVPTRKVPPLSDVATGHLSPVCQRVSLSALIERVQSPHGSSERLPSRPPSQQSVFPSDGPCSPTSVHPRLPSGSGVEVNVVTVGHFQPYWEETKPYEMSDFYKYSTKHRKCSGSDSQEASDDSKRDVSSTSVDGPRSPLSPASPREPCGQQTTQRNHPASSGTSQSMISSPEPPHQGPQTPQQHPSNLDTSLKLNVSPVAEQFHAECIAWYEDQDSCNTATLV